MDRLRLDIFASCFVLHLCHAGSFAAQPNTTDRALGAMSTQNKDESEDSRDAESVPELYRNARKEMEELIRQDGNGSVSALGKLGRLRQKAHGKKPRTEAALAAKFSELMKELRSTREATRRKVLAIAAVKVASREEVSALFPLLGDPDTRVAGGVAVTIVHRLDCGPQIGTWVLSQQDRRVADAGITILRSMNLPSSEAFIREIAAKHSNLKVREDAAKVLEQMEQEPRRGQHLMPRKSK